MLLKYLIRIEEEENMLDEKPKEDKEEKLLKALLKEDLNNVQAIFI